VLLVWVVGGLWIECEIDVCRCPLLLRPLGLSIGGGKPYPYVLTLKGKPLGRNPMRVNPTVYPYSNANENDSHSYLSHRCVEIDCVGV
jgi:hypothetical protein